MKFKSDVSVWVDQTSSLARSNKGWGSSQTEKKKKVRQGELTKKPEAFTKTNETKNSGKGFRRAGQIHAAERNESPCMKKEGKKKKTLQKTEKLVILERNLP